MLNCYLHSWTVVLLNQLYILELQPANGETDSEKPREPL